MNLFELKRDKMKIEYLCHSCLYIDTGDTTLVIDPWFKGGAYLGQWQLFPKPVHTHMLKDVKNILYSHGHEDHLHPESLKDLPQKARVFFPYQWRKGVKDFFYDYGFNDLTEAASFKSYSISPTTKITYIGFALESVIVIEHKNEVLVNINDALNSHHENVVAVFLKEIKKRWKKIDYLFSGWSGAGYFPNTVHYEGKNDDEIARIREQYFCNNFCKSIFYLQPKAAIPFAPGFVLLADERRWINKIKFPREWIESYYKEHFDPQTTIRFHVVNSGDSFANNQFIPYSAVRKKIIDEELDPLLEKMYPKEIEESRKRKFIQEHEAELLLKKMTQVLNDNIKLYDIQVLKEAHFSVCVKDLKSDHFLNADFEGDSFHVTRVSEKKPDRKIIISTTSVLLNYSFDHEWGGDAMTIGYGIDVDVFEELTLEQNLDIVCVRLLTRYPTASKSMMQAPLRAMGYFLRHPVMSKLALKQKFMLRKTVNKYPFNERDHWVTYSKCELCKVCNMPELNFEFGEQLGNAKI